MARELLNKDGSPMREYHSTLIEELLNVTNEQQTNLNIKKTENMNNKNINPIDWAFEQLFSGQIFDQSIIDIREKAKEMYAEQTEITEDTSDGFHTFRDLYAIRKAYNVALFNEWGSQIIYEKKLGGATIKSIKYHVHKSRKHHDGQSPFGKDNWFIVCALLPTGQISNHYPIEDWDLFKIPETKKALFEFDGHNTQDVIERLIKL
jgi:hypothetical protein